MQYLHHLGIFAFTMKHGGYCITLPEPERNIIPTPYCDNILDNDTNKGIACTQKLC
jgi:hypothetical protein